VIWWVLLTLFYLQKITPIFYSQFYLILLILFFNFLKEVDMSIQEVCTYEVVTTTKSTLIKEAAKLMKKNNIGNIVVVESEKPVGILTDRDIVTKVFADDKDANGIRVSDVMSSNLLVLKKDQGIKEAIDAMCNKGVRRAPIVDDNNKLCGIATVDDLLPLIANELHSVAKLVCKQVD
jgi:CBS domain-containing protein